MSHHRHCANEEVLHKGPFILWLTEMSKYSKTASPPPLKKTFPEFLGYSGHCVDGRVDGDPAMAQRGPGVQRMYWNGAGWGGAHGGDCEGHGSRRVVGELTSSLWTGDKS